MLFKKYVLKLLMVLVVMGLIAGCGTDGSKQNAAKTDSSKPQEKAQETIVLKGVTAWDENNIQSAGFPFFKQKVEELSKGRVKIEYGGGPEAIPSFNQADAVRNGVVDFAIMSLSYTLNQVPEGVALDYSELTAEEERNSGGFDYLNEIYNKKLNAQLLIRSGPKYMRLYLKNPVKSISDLKGKRIRSSATFIPFLKALGAESVVLPPGEMYSAIERGVIDGVIWPDVGITDFGLEKQIKAQVFPSFYNNDTCIVINLDKWKKLPKDVQDILKQAGLEHEKLLIAKFDDYYSNEQKKLTSAGLQTVNLPEDEFHKIANDAAWASVIEKQPEYGPKLAELFRKK